MVPRPTLTVTETRKICLTLDLDRAPDHVLEDTRRLLLAAGVPVRNLEGAGR